LQRTRVPDHYQIEPLANPDKTPETRRTDYTSTSSPPSSDQNRSISTGQPLHRPAAERTHYTVELRGAGC